ncbi:hypothetical protein KO498_15450 [Lentibacter algarum]|nr:hypothetical protein [Lentibacter algarum]MBU2983203.1 hypothetical protein [Lentibacter algarum]
MKKQKTVYGREIAAVRLTKLGAALLALAVALPFGCILWLAEWLLV